MEGGRVGNSWCKCVVSHDYGGLGGGRMEKVVGRYAGQFQGVGRMSGDVGAFSESEVNTLITPDRTTIQVLSSGYGRVRIGRSSWKGFNTGRHEKAPVRCTCCAANRLHGQRTGAFSWPSHVKAFSGRPTYCVDVNDNAVECFHAIVCGDYYFNQLFPSHVRQLNILITEVDIHATYMKHDIY